MSDSTATLKRKQSDDIDSPMPSSDPPSPSDSSSDNSSIDHAKVKRVRTTAETVSKKKSVSKLIGKYKELMSCSTLFFFFFCIAFPFCSRYTIHTHARIHLFEVCSCVFCPPVPLFFFVECNGMFCFGHASHIMSKLTGPMSATKFCSLCICVL